MITCTLVNLDYVNPTCFRYRCSLLNLSGPLHTFQLQVLIAFEAETNPLLISRGEPFLVYVLMKGAYGKLCF